MLGLIAIGKKALMVGAVATGFAAAVVQEQIATHMSQGLVTFVIGVLSFFGSVAASIFVSGRMVGKAEQSAAELRDQMKKIDDRAKELVDRNTLNMLDRLLTEKISDLKLAMAEGVRERDQQYSNILTEISRLRQRSGS